MKNWQKAEEAVYTYFSKRKDTYISRLSDTHDINAQLNRFGGERKMVYAKKKESDFLIVSKGVTFFGEVKCCANVKGVTSSLFQEQEGIRNRILRAGGKYVYFINSSKYNKWYAVPGEVISQKSNLTWSELSAFRVEEFE